MKNITKTFVLAGAIMVLSGSQQTAPMRPVSEVANHLSRASGFMVYVESKVAKEQLPWPVMPMQVSEAKLEEILAKVAKELPKGAAWAKLYLPPAPKDKIWKADEVVAFARAQAQLYGPVGSVETDSIEILSQKLPPERAKSIISDLNLKPVYLLSLGRGNYGGVWKTTFGDMDLKQVGTTVTGTYTSGSGRIEGIARGDRLEFRWWELSSGKGGPGYFILSEDGESFGGQWAYDESRENASSWTGTRVSRK